MSIEQMLFTSRLFLGLMIVGIVVSICLFFLLEVSKALHIVTGRTYKVRKSKSGVTQNTKTAQTVRRSAQVSNKQHIKSEQGALDAGKATTVLTRVLDMSMQSSRESEPTAILYNGELEQTVLLEAPKDKIEMLIDITFIHTKVII